MSWGLAEGVLTLVRQPGLREVGLHFLSISVAMNATLTLLAAGLLNIILFPLISRFRTDRFTLIAGTALFWVSLYAVTFLLYWMRPALPGLSSAGVSGPLVLVSAIVGTLAVARWVSLLLLRAAQFLLGGARAGTKKVLMAVLVAILALAYIDFGLVWVFVKLKEDSNENRPNVLLIVTDTVRADHVSVFGYDKETTPHLEKLAARGVAFSQAICQYPSSLGSHASLLTSLYPGAHCTYEHVPGSRLPEEIITLAEYFDDAGYRTVGILDNPWLSDHFGFTQGHDIYINANRVEVMDVPSFRLMMDMLLVKKFCSQFSEAVEPSTASAVSVLREMSGKPFYLFLHYITPHRPYYPPTPYDRMFSDAEAGKPEMPGGMQQGLFKLAKQHRIEISPELVPELAALYDGDIAYTDRQVGIVLDELEALGLTGSTVVVVTSDHGENFDDESPHYVGHGGLTEGGIHVPLIMSYPPVWSTPKVVDRVVELVDVVPTILELAGVPAVARLDGKSLVPLTAGNDSEEGVAFVQLHSDEFAVRTREWKLRIREEGGGLETTRQLFDITSGRDVPGQETDLTVTDSLFALYSQWKGDLDCLSLHTDREERFDSEIYEKLKALGYLQ